MSLRTRFAPAPTGYLHLGHVVNAIYVWGYARAVGAAVLLRIEDHDRQRCRPEFERALLEDLDWLGFVPDEGPLRQSDRGPVYQGEMERLREQGLVYVCDCSRREIALEAGDAFGEEQCYPGTCRERQLADAPDRGLRIRMEPGRERFEDLLAGRQEQDPSRQCGDWLIRDRRENWTYQFAVTVDDWLQQIGLVIRGEDLLPSTGRQLRLARLLGRPKPPRFLHHPLIRKPTGEKLSKASRDTGIRDLRAQGVAPSQVLGRAATLAGFLGTGKELDQAAIVRLFEARGSGLP